MRETYPYLFQGKLFFELKDNVRTWKVV